MDVIEDEGKLVISQKRATSANAAELKRGEVTITLVPSFEACFSSPVDALFI